MKEKFFNTVTLQGYLFDANIEVKTVKNSASANFGNEFIGGDIDVATDEEGLNVVKVHFTYVTPTNGGKNGKLATPNRTYSTLKAIIDNPDATWEKSGKDGALKVKVDTRFGVNEYPSTREENVMVVTPRCEGGFVTILNTFGEAGLINDFKIDTLITRFAIKESDDNPTYAEASGYAFDFRNALLPITYRINDENIYNFLGEQEISEDNPLLTWFGGSIVSTTIVTTTNEDCGFGQAVARPTTRHRTDWVMNRGGHLYEFGNEEILTREDIDKKLQDREIHLAEVRKRSEEYRAQNSGASATKPSDSSTASALSHLASAAPTTAGTATFNFNGKKKF